MFVPLPLKTCGTDVHSLLETKLIGEVTGHDDLSICVSHKVSCLLGTNTVNHGISSVITVDGDKEKVPLSTCCPHNSGPNTEVI